MQFKLPFKKRIPLVLLQRNGIIYCQMQYEVLREDRRKPGYYVEMYELGQNKPAFEIGRFILNLLDRFLNHPEWMESEVWKASGMTWENYLDSVDEKIMESLGAKSEKDYYMYYRMFHIEYDVESDRYKIELAWPITKGKQYYNDFSPSTGKPGLLTFPTPLEFDSTIAPELLGRMVLEAFDRCQQLTDAAAGNKFEVKELTLFDGSVLEIQMPRDKHFFDSGDMGTAEIYQMYEYFPKEDAEDAQAQFFLGIGEELNCDISQDNITAVWESNYGKAEFQEIKAVKQSIYCLRAELRNKTIHKVSYFVKQNEELLLECSMEVFQPGKRKKLEEKLLELFEEFAGRCRRK